MSGVTSFLDRVPDTHVAAVVVVVCAVIGFLAFLLYKSIRHIDITTKWFSTKARGGVREDKGESGKGDGGETGKSGDGRGASQQDDGRLARSFDNPVEKTLSEISRLDFAMQDSAISLVEGFTTNFLFDLRNEHGCPFQDLSFVYRVRDEFQPFILGDGCARNFLFASFEAREALVERLVSRVRSVYIDLVRLQDTVSCDQSLLPVNDVSGELQGFVRKLCESLRGIAILVVRDKSEVYVQALARYEAGSPEFEYISGKVSYYAKFLGE